MHGTIWVSFSIENPLRSSYIRAVYRERSFLRYTAAYKHKRYAINTTIPSIYLSTRTEVCRSVGRVFRAASHTTVSPKSARHLELPRQAGPHGAPQPPQPARCLSVSVLRLLASLPQPVPEARATPSAPGHGMAYEEAEKIASNAPSSPEDAIASWCGHVSGFALELPG